jgi:nicotinamidase-related amidase
MKKILIVIDMQNDFIDGALGTKEAQAIVENVVAKIQSYPAADVYATLDTHEADYLTTSEGKYLPVEHCIKGTAGWELNQSIGELLTKSVKFEKPTFGLDTLADDVFIRYKDIPIVGATGKGLEIEFVGLCTDVCVVTNALLFKTKLPDAKISVDPSCCAGVTPESHQAALLTMKMCQVEVG